MAGPSQWRPGRRPGYRPKSSPQPESAPPTLVGIVGPQSYTFGTHSQAIYSAELAKSVLFRPSIAGATPRIGAFVSASPQRPPDIGSLIFDPSIAVQQLGRFVSAAQTPYVDTQSQLFRSATAPITATQAAVFIVAGNQSYLDVASQIFRPSIAGATPTVGIFVLSPQQPYQDVGSRVFPTVRTPPAASGILGTFVNVPEQLADRSTPSSIWTPQFLPQGFLIQVLDQGPQFAPDVQSLIFQSARTAQATSGILGAFIVSPEQAFDRTQQAVLNQPWHGPQGAVPPFQIVREQFFDPTPGPVITRSQPAAVLVTGVTVFPLPPVPFQTDLNLNASVVWTPATFSPGIPPTPPTDIPLGPLGPVRSMFDASHKRRKKPRKEPDVQPATIEIIEQSPPPILKSLEPEIFATPLADLLDLDTKLQLSAKRLELLEQQKSDHEAALIALWVMLDD